MPRSTSGQYEQYDVMLIHGSPDIFAIGFQEIVPLTAQQIVQTDPEKKSVLWVFNVYPLMVFSRSVWEKEITNTLQTRPDNKSDYILLRSHQVRDLPPAYNLRNHTYYNFLAGWNCPLGSCQERTDRRNPQCRSGLP